MDGPDAPHLLDDAHRALGFALGHDSHDAVAEDREARAFARAATELVKKRHGYLGKLLLGPGASGEPEQLGRESVGPCLSVLDEVTEFDERP